MRKYRILPLLILVLAAAAIVAPAPNQKPNVVLITIDTLRADRVGCYGYARVKTPNIDRVASEGVLFTDAVSHVPLTRPSHTSIFTGLFPYQHGVHDNIAPPLAAKFATLAEILKRNGYQTAAFVASFVVNSQSGLNRGFDVYEDEFNPQKQPTNFALNLEKRGGEVYQEFADWMGHRNAKPYLAWIHLYDPHFPYAPPPPYSTSFAERPYDGEVAYADEIVGKILKLLDNNTLLVIASDHGESLGDHGENAHSYFIYDSTLRVPLMFRWPGVLPPGQKVSGQTRLVDLLPTILDLLSLPSPQGISGITLKSWLLDSKRTAPALTSYCETYTPLLHFGWSSLVGVRTAGWKYIEAPRSELYDLAKDPGERVNVLTQHAAEAKMLRAWLSKAGALETSGTPQEATPELDPEQLEKLASLGYAGVPTHQQQAGQPLADPKDKLEEFKVFNQLIREGIEAYQQERFTEAASKFQQLENKNNPSFEVHYYLGRSLLRCKSYGKSSTELEKAIEILPHFLPAYRDLSEAYEGLQNPKKAEAVLLQGLKVSPNHPLLVQSLAWLYQRQGRPAEAEKALVFEIKEHPEDTESRFRLAAIYRDTDRPQDAILQLKEIVKKQPSDSEAHNQLGMLYGGNDRLQEALAEFQEATRLNPQDKDIRHNLDLVKKRMASAMPLETRPSNSETIVFRVIETASRPAAELLLRKLKAGESWEKLATDYSIHPTSREQDSVLRMPVSEIDPVFAQTLSKLKLGEISPVVESAGRFYLLRRQ